MPAQTRRIVTGHDAEGKSIVLIDGPATAAGAYWFTDGTPADNSKSEDAVQLVRKLEPSLGGSIFRFATIPPENLNMTATERERTTVQLFAQMDATHCRTDTSRHPGMHKTRTIDYVVLLSGEVTMLLDKDEVELKPFDVVVQRGTSHAWINKGKEPALLAAVLIDVAPVFWGGGNCGRRVKLDTPQHRRVRLRPVSPPRVKLLHPYAGLRVYRVGERAQTAARQDDVESRAEQHKLRRVGAEADDAAVGEGEADHFLSARRI